MFFVLYILFIVALMTGTLLTFKGHDAAESFNYYSGETK